MRPGLESNGITMSIKVLLLYFVLGGSVIALVSYLGTQTRGLLASFFANLPTITVLSLSIIYANAGVSASTAYFKGLLLMLPAWVIYVLIVLFLLPRAGLVASLGVGVTLYVIAGMTIMRFLR